MTAMLRTGTVANLLSLEDFMISRNPPLASALLSVLFAMTAPAGIAAGGARPVAVEFSHTPAPQTDDERLITYTRSVAQIKFANGKSRAYPLTYVTLFKNTDLVSSVKGRKYAAGQIYDFQMNPVLEPTGDRALAETPDGNTLLTVGGKLFLTTNWEYDDVLTDGREARKAQDWYARMPMPMTVSELTQDRKSGHLALKKQWPVDLSSVEGGWIFCNASQTPWNTHLAGEEDYDLFFLPTEKGYKKTQAGLKAMNEVYFRGQKQANPYRYGYHVELALGSDGSQRVVKHYQMGRGSWEMAQFAKDGRTAFYGDDGTYVGLFMFVGQRRNDPGAGGTLYAAKWLQTAPDGADGGSANIQWIRLGTASHGEIRALIESGIKAEDIFEIAMSEQPGFVPIRAGSAETVWLKLKPGMEQAAAFLETRRYAAYLGATTEFSKGEGVAIDHVGKKLYYAVSAIQGSMKANDGGPVDHIRLKENLAGATYTFELAVGQKDSEGQPIDSEYVPVRAYVEPALLGRSIAVDNLGNTADPEAIANPDNLFFSERMRTLFIGEDSTMHVNNFVWAYNVDTKKLARILSLPAGAEATGLKVIENLNGHAYILANDQHQGGDWAKGMSQDLKDRLLTRAAEKWGRNRHGVPHWRLEAQVGYIGGLPGF
ncbi:PhoX family protein [Thiobacter aerophilum]|uniref:Alkaline phosphatase PhoX n=1 Tax=Thiobacter aerophilum TaxID=3121275 RepID=A0ABV0EIS5_9BURK